mmetsp:Transcript_26119/g.57078  ORF Transcript_26119/g.57078 Transcript_26119/m.57078 type:complete len:113 (+) Transcript_26119:39-377(+)
MSALTLYSRSPGVLVQAANRWCNHWLTGNVRFFSSGGKSDADDDEGVAERKRQAVKSYMATQLGEDKAALAQLLQRHGVVVKGGPAEAQALLDALLVWKRSSTSAQTNTQAS